VNVGIQTVFHLLHPHLRRAALPRSPFHDFDLAQNDLWRGLFGSFVGALSLLPVARLVLARPLAVNPAPLDAGNFSPLPTERLGFLAIYLTIISAASLTWATRLSHPFSYLGLFNPL